MSEKGICIGQNLTAERMFGYFSEEAVGRSGTEWITPEFRELVSRKMLEGYEEPYEAMALRKDGTSFHCEIQGRMVNYQGRLIRVTALRDITDRKKAEESLRGSEEKYRLLVENQIDMVVKVDTVGRFLFVSPSYCRTFGKEEKELLGKKFMPLVHVDDREHTAREMQKLYSPPYSAYIEQRAKTADGWRWMAWLDTAVRDDDGNVVEIIGVGRDITDQKQVEEILRESEERYRTLFECAGDGIIVVQAEGEEAGRIVSANQVAAEMHGYNLDEFLSLSMSDLDTPEEVLPMADILSSVRQGKMVKTEHSHRKKDGSILQIELNAGLIEMGGRRYSLSINRDITDRKHAEEALRNSEKKYRLIFENIQDVYYETSIDGTILEVSPSVETLSGYARDELLGKSILEIYFDPGQREPIMEAMLRDGAVQDYELTATDKDGSQRLCSATARLVTDEEGRPWKTCGILRDISERKRAEEEVNKLAAVVRHSSELVNLSDLDGRMIFLNDAGSRMLGIAPEDVSNHFILEVIPEDLLSKVRTELLPELLKGGTWEGDLKYRNLKTADLTDVHAMCFSIKDPDTKAPLFLANVSLDITDRKRAEEALRKNEEMFRAIFEQAAVGVAQIISRTGEFVRINQRYCDIVGRTREEMIRLTFQEITHPEDLQPDLDNMELLLEGKIREFSMEKRYYHKNGDIVWVNLTVSAMWVLGAEPGFHIAVVEEITDRKKADEELARTKALLEAVIHQSPIPMVIALPDGTVTTFNDACSEQLGFQDEPHMRPGFNLFDFEQSWKDYDSEGNLVPVEELPLALALRGKFTKNRVIRVVRKDGRERWEMVNGAPILDKEGNIIAGFVAFPDITDRKLAEAELLSHMSFLTIMEEIDARIRHATSYEEMTRKVLAKVRQVLKCDRAWLLYPCDPTASSFRVPMESTHPDYPGAFALNEDIPMGAGAADDCRRALNANGPLTFGPGSDNPVSHETAEHFSVQSQMFMPVHPQVGKPWLFGVHQCTHAREWKKDEQKLFKEIGLRLTHALSSLLFVRNLEDSEKKYRNLFEESTDAILIVRPGGEIVDANPSCSELFGAPLNNIIGASVLNYYWNPSDRNAFREIVDRNGYVRDFEWTVRKEDGSQRECLLSSSVWKDENGTIIGYLSIARDVTEPRRLEKQLVQSQKMEAVGTLAGGVAHDFNNLLHVIQGYAEMGLLSINRDQAAHSELLEIKRAAKRAAELTQGLLTFSRRVEGQRQPLDLNLELRQISKMLERTIPKMIAIDLNLAGDLRPVEADPGQLQQAVMNLAVNARDAMPEGGSLLIETANAVLDEKFCKALPGAEPGVHVMLAVSDTGSGMDKETKEKIFDPFFTTKEVGKGTGLGLSIVFGIVKSHGGFITCRSEPGQGTTFKIHFPAIKQAQRPEVEIQSERLIGGTETILLVDDEDSVRRLGESILQRFGYTVLKASNGREALEVFRERQDSISLVILDLIMPEMGGRECLREILNMDPAAKVLIASGYGANGQIDGAVEEGARTSIRKPYEARQLLEAVRRVLDEKET
ncbi:PAS domain S-box protein [Thermodesulfobacteriota bacterium]